MGEREETQLIDERDSAEECASQMYYLVTGRSPEWSNMFGYGEANEEVGDAVALLKTEIADLSRRLAEAGREIERFRMLLQGILEWWHSLPPTFRQDAEGSGFEPAALARTRAALTTTPPPGSAAG